MKNSGIEWIGEIPVGWEVRRNKTLFNCSKVIVGSESNTTQLLSLTTQGIKTKSQEAIGGKVPESFDTYQIVNTGDIVMCLFDLDCSAVFSGISPYNGMISPAYKVLKCKDEILPQYVDYWFKFVFNGRKFKTYAKNLRYTLNYDEFSILPCVLPTYLEQQKIASFLDQKCAEIDAVIEKTKATIEEYKKLKQSVITEAVTKGIRGNRPMKDSGIEWIGKFPAEWIFAELKMFSKVNNGKEISNEIDKETKNSVPVFGSGGVFKYTDVHMYDGETVMFGRKGTLGKPIHVTGKIWVVDTMYYLTHTSKLLPKFNYYQLIAFDWIPYITQTALPSIVASQIVACKFVFPDIYEQKEIADYLDQKCLEIDTLITKKITLLIELETYKKSLIYEYVTGKKEVK